ncbi:MAG: DUF2752 domain-containing protein [Planctomycetaceae bacterium]|nr:DUF2752 domain-containing protein [Planctomycetaceae bacterium]
MVCHSRGHGCSINGIGRLLLVAWGVFLLGGFALAVSLTPDSNGFGTHRQLGFPPCSFQTMFEIPCPSCGMTTAFAHFVRGEWISAANANIGGLLLAMVCAGQLPWSFASAWRGELWGVRNPDTWLMWLIAALTVVTGANWLVELIS